MAHAVRRICGQRDLQLAVLIFFAAAAFALIHLAFCLGVLGPEYGDSPETFKPSLLIACGKGFYTCEPFPALTDFMEQKTLSFSPDQLPPNLVLRSLDNSLFDQDRRYLLYGVGILWRLVGISWGALKIFLALVFGATAVAGFGIFRLGMNRVLSVACTALFMLSPVVISHLPVVRDFSKAPFVLGAIFLMAYLIRYRVSRRTYWAIAIGLGVVIGIGLGFRTDLMVYIPPAVFIPAVCARGLPRLSVSSRGIAVALFAVTLVAVAWPVLKTMVTSKGANSFYMLQGFATSCLDSLNMPRSSYDQFPLHNDYLMYATTFSYDTRMKEREDRASGFRSARVAATRLLTHGVVRALTLNPVATVLISRVVQDGVLRVILPETRGGFLMGTPQDEEAGRRVLREIASVFPADIIARAYAATLRVLRGVGGAGWPWSWHARDVPWLVSLDHFLAPLNANVERFGLYYAAAVLLILSAKDVWLGFLGLAFLLYFCGYTSLSFQIRHAFHLQLVPIWILGFLVSGFWLLLRNFRSLIPSFRSGPTVLAPFLRRAMVFGLVACLLLLAPLYGARLYQRFSVRRFIEKCTAAPLEPLDLESAPADGWIRFCPASWTSSDHPAADFRSWLRTEYLVAEFDVGSEPIPFRISYEMPSADFSYPETIRPMSTGRPLTVKYFFPVYEFHGPRLIPIPPNHFRGIMLREADRARLRGLSRVRNVEDFPILPCMFIPSDRSLFQWYRPLPALFCWPPSRP